MPRNQRQMIFEIPSSFKPREETLSLFKQVNKLLAINYALINSKNDKLKNVISNWNAGGTNVTKDGTTVEDLIKANAAEADRIIKEILTKTYTHTTKLRTRRSSLNYRYHYGRSTVRMPSGNVHGRGNY